VSILEAAVLGLLQGLTEFLPISSTAHLRIVPALLGWKDSGAAFTAVLQLGTLVAVAGYFLPELLGMCKAALGPDRKSDPRAARLLHLLIATLPIGIVGLAFKSHIEGPLRHLAVIATSLIVVGLVMALAERFCHPTRELDDTRMRDALLIGLAQTLALVPGVSRSGITLVAAMALGMRRDAAARYSFLLGIPAIGAAGVLELPTVLRATDIGPGALAVGLVISTVSGYVAISWLLKFLRTRSTLPFVIYRVALGLLLLSGLAAGWL